VEFKIRYTWETRSPRVLGKKTGVDLSCSLAINIDSRMGKGQKYLYRSDLLKC